jgi:ABC-type lipoprotein release transport system permease subunit
MNIADLIYKEIRHRKLSFALGALAVAAAVGAWVGVLALLEAHDARTALILKQKETQTRVRMAELEDAMRKAMLRLGFNIVVLPKDQKLDDWYGEDTASKYLPEAYIQRLATSRVVTVQHILPTLQQKIKWPEAKRTIILVGTRGELPGADAKKPLLQPVAPGHIILGHELHDSLGLKTGDKLTLLGRPFTVAQCYPMRGNKDDITAWIHLREAQELLDKPGLINALLALECACAFADLPKVRQELTALLPGTQVIERGSEALARAEARRKVGEEAVAALAREQENRARLRVERERLGAVVIPVVMLASALALMALMFANVRARRPEIGLLRALGVRGGQILGLFLGKALLAGLAGGLLGALLGWLAGRQLNVALEPGTAGAVAVQFKAAYLALALVLAPVLAMLSSWIPATWAARQDPALILAEE